MSDSLLLFLQTRDPAVVERERFPVRRERREPGMHATVGSVEAGRLRRKVAALEARDVMREARMSSVRADTVRVIANDELLEAARLQKRRADAAVAKWREAQALLDEVAGRRRA